MYFYTILFHVHIHVSTTTIKAGNGSMTTKELHHTISEFWPTSHPCCLCCLATTNIVSISMVLANNLSIFLCAHFAILISSLMKHLLIYFVYFIKDSLGLFLFCFVCFYCWILRILYMVWYIKICWIYGYKYFFLDLSLSPHSLNSFSQCKSILFL